MGKPTAPEARSIVLLANSNPAPFITPLRSLTGLPVAHAFGDPRPRFRLLESLRLWSAPLPIIEFLGLSLAGTALAADTAMMAPVVRAPNVVQAEAALERARTSNSASKVGPLAMAQRNQLAGLIADAKAGKMIEPGAIDALISAVGH